RPLFDAADQRLHRGGRGGRGGCDMSHASRPAKPADSVRTGSRNRKRYELPGSACDFGIQSAHTAAMRRLAWRAIATSCPSCPSCLREEGMVVRRKLCEVCVLCGEKSGSTTIGENLHERSPTQFFKRQPAALDRLILSHRTARDRSQEIVQQPLPGCRIVE